MKTDGLPRDAPSGLACPGNRCGRADAVLDLRHSWLVDAQHLYQSLTRRVVGRGVRHASQCVDLRSLGLRGRIRTARGAVGGGILHACRQQRRSAAVHRRRVLQHGTSRPDGEFRLLQHGGGDTRPRRAHAWRRLHQQYLPSAPASLERLTVQVICTAGRTTSQWLDVGTCVAPWLTTDSTAKCWPDLAAGPKTCSLSAGSVTSAYVGCDDKQWCTCSLVRLDDLGQAKAAGLGSHARQQHLRAPNDQCIAVSAAEPDADDHDGDYDQHG